MMNWIYTWYNPKVDLDSVTVAEQMSRIFLEGISGARSERAEGVVRRVASGRATSPSNGSRVVSGISL